MPPVIPPGDDRDRRPEVLPPSLLPVFDDHFVATNDLFEEYVACLALGIARELGAGDALQGGGVTVAGLARRLGLDPERSAVALGWLVRLLALRGHLEEKREDGAGPRYEASGPLPAPDPAEVASRQAGHDEAALPGYRIAAVAAAAYPAFLRGEVTGEQVLFSAENAPLWGAYFSNDNPLYAINNTVGALAVESWIDEGPRSVLELGGGFGSAALALLDRLEAGGRMEGLERYRFTELSIPFMRRGQRALRARWGEAPFLEFGRTDMDRSLDEQGLKAGQWSLVWAVNTLHVAHDLAFTLSEIRSALTPGGMLVIGECVRPFPGHPVEAELIFNLLEAFRTPVLEPGWRPNGGFLTPEQWTEALERTGFGQIRFLPAIERVREVYPSFVVSALGAVAVP